MTGTKSSRERLVENTVTESIGGVGITVTEKKLPPESQIIYKKRIRDDFKFSNQYERTTFARYEVSSIINSFQIYISRLL